MTPTIEAAARAICRLRYLHLGERLQERKTDAHWPVYLSEAEAALSAVMPMIEREAVLRCAKVARDTFDGEKALRVNCEIGSIDRNLHNWGMNVAMDIEVAIRALVPKEATDG